MHSLMLHVNIARIRAQADLMANVKVCFLEETHAGLLLPLSKTAKQDGHMLDTFCRHTKPVSRIVPNFVRSGANGLMRYIGLLRLFLGSETLESLLTK